MGLGLRIWLRWMGSEPAKLWRDCRNAAGLWRLSGRLRLWSSIRGAEWIVTVDDLYFRHKVSPYVGRQVKGRVERRFCVARRRLDGMRAARECFRRRQWGGRFG